MQTKVIFCLWMQLRELASSSGEQKTYFKVKLAIQKPFWWQLTLEILLDSSTFSAVENILQKMGIIWTTSKKKKEIFCTNVIMEKMNIETRKIKNALGLS